MKDAAGSFSFLGNYELWKSFKSAAIVAGGLALLSLSNWLQVTDVGFDQQITVAVAVWLANTVKLFVFDNTGKTL